jgi:hypothetical protein
LLCFYLSHSISIYLCIDVPLHPSQSPSPKKKLDTVFFKKNDQEHWGRTAALGQVRKRELQEHQILKAVGHTRKSIEGESGGAGGDEKVKPKPAMSRTGMILLDTRKLPKVTSRTLTIKHPGMNCFNDSVSSIENVSST